MLELELIQMWQDYTVRSNQRLLWLQHVYTD